MFGFHVFGSMYFPDKTGCHVYFPKIHLVSKCVWSADPAGQQVCVHQIHLILTSVFSHIEAVCVPLLGKVGEKG